MSSYFLLSFIIHPVVGFLCNPARKWNRYRKSTGRDLALLVLLAIALCNSLKIEKNYFQLLKVTPHSSVEQIKKSFKQEALLVHPDRNPSPKASQEYVEMTRVYKILINSKLKEAYNRYGDIITEQNEKLQELTPAEVLYVVFITSSTSLFGIFLVIILYGQRTTNKPALFYEMFCFALDIYLRLSPDSSSFMNFVPVLRFYTIFEIIAVSGSTFNTELIVRQFFRNFRLFFMYYSSIFGKDEEKDVSWKAGATIVKNNLLVIKNLDMYIRNIRKIIPSVPPVAKTSHDPLGEEKRDRDQKQSKTSLDTQQKRPEVPRFPSQQSEAKWNKSRIQDLLTQTVGTPIAH